MICSYRVIDQINTQLYMRLIFFLDQWKENALALASCERCIFVFKLCLNVPEYNVIIG